MNSQDHEFSFWMEYNTRSTLKDMLTYKEILFHAKEESVQKVESIAEVSNFHVQTFDGS